MGIGPEEWLGYFSQASYIFTNFFHGVVFSIIYRKPFTNFINPGKSIKVKDLLGELNLCDRIVTESEISDLPTKLNWEMNFDCERLNDLLEQSKQYLRQLL
jgi:exopolysaccharide biosynthesis predicted pyruvyltransferase EpsI